MLDGETGLGQPCRGPRDSVGHGRVLGSENVQDPGRFFRHDVGSCELRLQPLAGREAALGEVLVARLEEPGAAPGPDLSLQQPRDETLDVRGLLTERQRSIRIADGIDQPTPPPHDTSRTGSDLTEASSHVRFAA